MSNPADTRHWTLGIEKHKRPIWAESVTVRSMSDYSYFYHFAYFVVNLRTRGPGCYLSHAICLIRNIHLTTHLGSVVLTLIISPCPDGCLGSL